MGRRDNRACRWIITLQALQREKQIKESIIIHQRHNWSLIRYCQENPKRILKDNKQYSRYLQSLS
ncbi:unnamed protein product [Paramecium sonneborni]|uniref:Uncharacterized protein n=1 Tax=Paramecium sonneborni TaxID=65129 RepID=A0A8S1NSE4_9CILI|nr:unnamed protein product [Paramecium sonneborni]